MYKFQKSVLFLEYPFCGELANELNINFEVDKHQGIITFIAESEQLLNFYQYLVSRIIANMQMLHHCYKEDSVCA